LRYEIVCNQHKQPVSTAAAMKNANSWLASSPKARFAQKRVQFDKKQMKTIIRLVSLAIAFLSLLGSSLHTFQRSASPSCADHATVGSLVAFPCTSTSIDRALHMLAKVIIFFHSP
jgi:hypothetical protein